MANVEVEVGSFENGRVWCSESHKKGGETTKNGSTAQYAKRSPQIAVQRISVSSGRTINLGQFNFARVDVSLSFDHDSSHDDAFMNATQVVDEIIDREIASLGKNDRKNVSVSLSDDSKNVTIGVTYGLTVSVKNMNSVRIDYGVTQPVDGENIDSAFSELQTHVGKKVFERKEALRNGTNEDFGL